MLLYTPETNNKKDCFLTLNDSMKNAGLGFPGIKIEG